MPKTPKALAVDPEMKRSNYYMPEEYKRGLKKVARQTGDGTEASHLREAVRRYLKLHKVLD